MILRNLIATVRVILVKTFLKVNLPRWNKTSIAKSQLKLTKGARPKVLYYNHCTNKHYKTSAFSFFTRAK